MFNNPHTMHLAKVFMSSYCAVPLSQVSDNDVKEVMLDKVCSVNQVWRSLRVALRAADVLLPPVQK
jgi:hypothetical protein